MTWVLSVEVSCKSMIPSLLIITCCSSAISVLDFDQMSLLPILTTLTGYCFLWLAIMVVTTTVFSGSVLVSSWTMRPLDLPSTCFGYVLIMVVTARTGRLSHSVMPNHSHKSSWLYILTFTYSLDSIYSLRTQLFTVCLQDDSAGFSDICVW